MPCVAAGPAETALQIALALNVSIVTADRWQCRIIRRPAFVAILVCILFGLVLVVTITGYWQTNLPREMDIDFVSHADEEAPPGT